VGSFGARQGVADKGPNRRRYLRVPAEIHCRPAGVEFFAQHLEPIDISFGGLRIYADESYEVGANLRLDVFFPSAAPVPCTTEVMWVKKSSKGAPARFEVGLAFVDLGPESLALLRPLLAKPRLAKSVNPAPASSAKEAPRTGSAVETGRDPVSEVRPVTRPPVSARQSSNIRALPSDIPCLVAGVDHLRAAQLDARSGFLLSLIDGATTVENLLDLSGMSADNTLALLGDLRQRGIVELRRGSKGS